MSVLQIYQDFVAYRKIDRDIFRRLEQQAGVKLFQSPDAEIQLVMIPYFIKLVEEGESGKITDSFDFLEKMALSQDPETIKFLKEILESFILKGNEFLSSCRVYMENQTLSYCLQLEKKMDDHESL